VVRRTMTQVASLLTFTLFTAPALAAIADDRTASPPAGNVDPAPTFEFALGDRLNPTRVIPGQISSRFPDESTGTVVTLHRSTGLAVRQRPKGLFVRHLDGERVLLAAPKSVQGERDAFGAHAYRGVYPGVATRWLGGSDYVKLELILEQLPTEIDIEDGDELVFAWTVDLANAGLLVRLSDDGGMVVLDLDQQPVLWLMAPVVVDGRVRVSGDPLEVPSFPTSYGLAIVDGEMELSVAIALSDLLGVGLSLPLTVDATTVDLLSTP